MLFDMSTLAPQSCYKILTATVTPRPIAWVSSQSSNGTVNVAPFSFFNIMGHNPPTVTLGLLQKDNGKHKDTTQNILETGEFVINLVPFHLAEAMNQTCANVASEVNEFELAGLTEVASIAVAPPRILESPVAFECKTLQAIETGPGQFVIIGKIFYAHIDDQFIQSVERLHIDACAMDLVARMHGSGWYSTVRDRFQLKRP